MSDAIAAEARRLFTSAQAGLLSTLSLELPGFPASAVVAYARDRAGRALFLASPLAEHARQVMRDNRVSLAIGEDDDGDPWAASQLTVFGHAVPVPAAERDDSARRLCRRFPQAEAWHRAHDFDLYRLEPVRARHAPNFGEACWLDPGALCAPNPFPAAVEEDMLAHMNCSHVAAMRRYCRLFAIEPGEHDPRLVAIDHEGFDLMVGTHLLRIEFERPVCSTEDVRREMVALAMHARHTGLQAA
jgi:putative heme iron utilization protein